MDEQTNTWMPFLLSIWQGCEGDIRQYFVKVFYKYPKIKGAGFMWVFSTLG